MTFQGGTSAASTQRCRVVWPVTASQCFQIAKIANVPTSVLFCSFVTMGQESSVQNALQRATSHAFREAMNPNRQYVAATTGLTFCKFF